jgi:phosphoribosylformylglycinamidine synthase I
MKPKVLILFAPGTNRDGDLSVAFQQAGAEVEIQPLNILRQSKTNWMDYQILALPGGFSYADALGAGKLWALDLQVYFKEEMQEFVAAGKPVIGICNGFQALVKSGVLPGWDNLQPSTPTTLTFNQCGHFECRWVHLEPVSQTCLWTRGLSATIDCPIAHGEGNFQLKDPSFLKNLEQADQIALRYQKSDGSSASSEYPFNPNGSIADIAGICNPQGNVLGLMPHPEDHIFTFQNPLRLSGNNHSGLVLFQNGVRYAEQL